jgi:hypothetical protein
MEGSTEAELKSFDELYLCLQKLRRKIKEGRPAGGPSLFRADFDNEKQFLL